MFLWDKHKTITCYYESLTKAVCDKFDLTQMEYDILMFLYNNPQYNTAADIVKVRKSTKSHVSTSLKMLEDKGFIKKRISEENKKRIEITLMDNAQEMINDGLNVQNKFIESILSGLSEEEMAVCRSVFAKMCSNAENCLKDLINTKKKGE